VKRSTLKLRLVITTLVCLAILAGSLLVIVPVSAGSPNNNPTPGNSVVNANADFPIVLQGYATNGTLLHSFNLTQAQFNAAVAADYPGGVGQATYNIPQDYHDATKGNTGILERGIALYRLVGLVDDYDPTAFNTSLYGTYSVRITGQNNDGTTYVKTFAPSAGDYSGLSFKNDENIFLANQIQYPTSVGEIYWVNAGSGYTLPPIVTITPAVGDTTGAGATAITTITSGQVSAITVINHGSGYTVTPVVTITPAAGDTTGSGATGIANEITGNSNWYDMPYLSATSLTKLFFPTVLSGNDIVSPGNRIGATTKIELLNLPPTPPLPASSGLGIELMIAGLAAMVVLFTFRRVRQSQR
jgi:hypothetical protein